MRQRASVKKEFKKNQSKDSQDGTGNANCGKYSNNANDEVVLLLLDASFDVFKSDSDVTVISI